MKRRQILIISITAILLMTIGLILIDYNKIGREYYDILIKINVIVQLFCIFLYIISGYKSKSLKITRLRFDDKLIKDDFQLSPTSPRNQALFNVYWEMTDFINEDPSTLFNISIIDKNGKEIDGINNRILNTKTEIVNDKLLFNTNIKVMPNEKINFKFIKEVEIKIFNVEEVYVL